MLWTMANYDDGPTAIRYPRGAGLGVKPKDEPVLLEIGKAEVIQDGADVALFPLGHTMDIGLETKKLLEEKGYSVAFIKSEVYQAAG